jgi:hypothetical protein
LCGIQKPIGKLESLPYMQLQTDLDRRWQPERCTQLRRDGARTRFRQSVRLPDLSLGGLIDYNLANAGGLVITFEGRSPYLDFDVPEAILWGNSAFSKYHSAQFSLNKRLSKGLQFNRESARRCIGG